MAILDFWWLISRLRHFGYCFGFCTFGLSFCLKSLNSGRALKNFCMEHTSKMKLFTAIL